MSKDSTMDSMGYPMGSAGTKQYFSKVLDGGTSLSEVLLSEEMIHLWNIYVVQNMLFSLCNTNKIPQ